MPFICDAHVHLYPVYDLSAALRCAAANLEGLAPSSEKDTLFICCLVERSDCHYYRGLASGRFSLAPGIEAAPLGGGEGVAVSGAGKKPFVLLPGRQINTAERLELLALAWDGDIKDGLPFSEVQQRIQDTGGLTVINWAPGKWMFKRGRMIARLLETCRSAPLLVGDTTLRPALWPVPRLMKKAEVLGHRVVFGSDALPLPGEERLIGSYAFYCAEDLDAAAPLSSLRALLRSSRGVLRPLGRRSSLPKVICRVAAYTAARRRERRGAAK